jgi:UDP-N-acetyl-2-amino-2-deoxyglucuronate dehydrogenase
VFGEASTKWYRSQGYYDSAAWRGTWALDGGALMNQGIHYVDLLRWCMGPVTEVTALCRRHPQVEVEDTALALVRFASGAVGTITASTAIYPGFAQRLEVAGTGGSIVVEDGAITYSSLTADPGRLAVTGAAAEPAANAPAAHAAQIADLLAAIDEGREPAAGAQSGRDALEIVCAIYQSARAGSPVRLPLAAQ